MAEKTSIYKYLRDTPLLFYVVAPLTYALVVPILILDIFAQFYQYFCLAVYGIPKVRRRDYILMDRHKLKYLNLIERINCDYCSYFNGVIGYVREVASRTEQYFCPIKHSFDIKVHSRHQTFFCYGDADSYHSQRLSFREKLNEDVKD